MFSSTWREGVEDKIHGAISTMKWIIMPFYQIWGQNVMNLTSHSRVGEKPEFWQHFLLCKSLYVLFQTNSCSSLLIEAVKQDFWEQYDSDHIYF